MDLLGDQSLASPLKHSYLGSFHLPPDRIPPPLSAKGASDVGELNLHKGRLQPCSPVPDANGKAVIAALKKLQEKMRRLELERVQAQNNVRQLSRAGHWGPATREPQQDPATEGASASSQELLQSAEARCNLLEKQLDYMKKMMEKAEKDKLSIIQKQSCLLRSRMTDQADFHTKLEKLEKLERECLKLTSTQSEAEKKLEALDQKLLAEKRERLALQEKVSWPQRDHEDDCHLHRSPASESAGRKKRKMKAVRKTAKVKSAAPVSLTLPKATVLPFVAGMSTSSSHSVHANIQSVLHMMKHHPAQPRHLSRPCQKLSPFSSRGTRRTLIPSQGASASGSLSEVLLALQDELGQMSFEHQELAKQIKETQKHGLREDLERELDCLVRRMKDKGTQISQLRKHQQEVEKLKQKALELKSSTESPGKGTVRQLRCTRPPPQSPLPSDGVPQRAQTRGKRGTTPQPKQAQGLQTSLKRSDILWET
ncbi:centrosomal protein CEP57L1 [Brienomyrus brachyistius]|uniref:centrosomal protein CEP57L1 n=1 Tax=Brienomyrus brachyistius TaxID=42636 RepID=UPI0020B3BBFB|nr:centrosomal protein CEP57L1 [Brienomyrus brachyistius]